MVRQRLNLLMTASLTARARPAPELACTCHPRGGQAASYPNRDG
jgi:hypothetical protein